MDSSSQLLPANRAARVQNFTMNHLGRLLASFQPTTISQQFPAGIDGVAYYEGSEPSGDRILVVSAGSMWEGTPAYPQTDPPTYSLWGVIGNGFNTGKQVRSVPFAYELIFVQEGGIQPLRYDGTGLYQLGVSPPSSAPLAQQGVPFGGASTKKLGVISYAYTLYDNHLRESDISPLASVDYTVHTTSDGLITISFGSDPQVTGAYIYATTQGSNTLYRIATLPKASFNTTFEDNLLDSIVITGEIAPTLGENALPAPASCAASLKEHVFMNSTDDPAVLQVSNISNPTLWATVAVLATDGQRMQITTDQGDPITAIVPFGSILGVWKRRAFYQLWGDSNSSFILRQLFLRGTVSASSCVRCDNDLFALLDDGVYKMDYNQGFINTKVSQEIEVDLNAFTPAQLSNAVAAFADNRYYLAIGSIIYFYDMNLGSPGWGSYCVNPEANYNGMIAVTPRQGKPVLYLTDSSTNTLISLDTNSANAQLVNGVYNFRTIIGEGTGAEEDIKRGKRLKVYGTGENCSCTLNVTLDETRNFSLQMSGPYSVNDGILFFQEFDPAVMTFYLSDIGMSNIQGTGVEINKSILDMVQV